MRWAHLVVPLAPRGRTRLGAALHIGSSLDEHPLGRLFGARGYAPSLSQATSACAALGLCCLVRSIGRASARGTDRRRDAVPHSTSVPRGTRTKMRIRALAI